MIGCQFVGWRREDDPLHDLKDELTQTLRNWQKNVVTNKQIRENAKKKPVKAGVKVKRKNVKNHNLIQSVSNAI